MNKGLIIGIDFSADFSQMACLNTLGEPESVSMGYENQYLMPTIMFYNEELNEWAVGEEAINRSKTENGKLIENLPEAMFEDEYKEQRVAIMTAFLEKFISIAQKCGNGQPVKKIVLTVQNLTQEIMECFYQAVEIMGYTKSDARIVSHSECFIYYVLNQHKDIWINKVLMFDFPKNGLIYRKLSINNKRESHIADVDAKELNNIVTFDMLESNKEMADAKLAEFIEEELSTNVVSAVFFSGTGFYTEGWQKTFAAVCQNRRVFKGNNLIVKGAAYTAKELFYISNFSEYIISCKGRTKVNVSMVVNYQGRETSLLLSKAGVNWYEAGAKAECILEKPTDAKFIIQSPITKDSENFFVNLKDFPYRKNKTVRLGVTFAYVSEDRFVVEIKDLGFGEFYESSGKVVREGVKL